MDGATTKDEASSPPSVAMSLVETQSHKEPRLILLRRIARQSLVVLICAATGYAAWLILMTALYRFVDPPLTTVMLERALRGRPIDQRWLALDAISPNLIKAVIVSEDAHYCRHWGVDWGELADAIRHGDRGGSTIPMQAVKNLFLWPGRSFLRKALEIPETLFVGNVWGKRRMLEIYLNIAEWGPGVFGAEAAARFHFGTSAGSLTVQQAALLVAALPSPLRRRPGAPGRLTRQHAAIVRGKLAAEDTDFRCVLGTG
jgi:monofunctional glycosyltransferase